jgi:dipeptidyl aminopeptidase/acylaminoacyl peptidase
MTLKLSVHAETWPATAPFRITGVIVQADDDRSVPSTQSSELLEDLRAHHVEYEQLVLPNEMHDLTRYASWMSFFQATDGFFQRHLRALQ